MESALYGIFTLVGFVSEISLVRCAHSFDFRYFTNSCENPVRMRFPWSNLYLSTGFIMWIGHRKEIESFRFSLRWPIHVINPVDKTKLSCNTPTDAAPQLSLFRNLPPLSIFLNLPLEVLLWALSTLTSSIVSTVFSGPVADERRKQWFVTYLKFWGEIDVLINRMLVYLLRRSH